MKRPVSRQRPLTPDFTSPYFTSHLLFYIGNRRQLLPFLHQVFTRIKKSLGKKNLVTFDGFSGSGAVSRLLKYHSKKIIANDLEKYSATINQAYLANKSEVNQVKLSQAIDYLNSHRLDKTASPGFFARHCHDFQPQPGLSMIYTANNTRIIDNVRSLIDAKTPSQLKVYCLANLLIKASIHHNLHGFAGRDILLESPIFSQNECEVVVTAQAANQLVKKIKPVDLAYYDPPQDQRSFGLNYSVLNLINQGSALIPAGARPGWNRSSYNHPRLAPINFDRLLASTPAKYIVISYNLQGIIPPARLKKILSRHGQWQKYANIKGSIKDVVWVLKKN